MAKESGLGMSVAVDNASSVAKTISNDLTSITIATPRAIQDVTGLDKSAMERLFLIADASVEMGGIFNDAADKSHDVFKTIPSTSVPRTVLIGVSGQSLSGVYLLTDYPLERGDDGALTYTVPGALADGTVPTWS